MSEVPRTAGRITKPASRCAQRQNHVGRQIRHLPGLVVAALLLVSGCSSNPAGQASAHKPGGIPNLDITAEFEQSAAGWNAGNLDAFMAIYADDATFARPDSFVRGKAAIREVYAPVFVPGTARDSLGMEQLEISPISSEIVLVRGIYRNMREGQVTRRGTCSLLMRLTGSHWRIIHDHSN